MKQPRRGEMSQHREKNERHANFHSWGFNKSRIHNHEAYAEEETQTRKGSCCGFSLCVPIWVLFSWLCGQSSTGVLYSTGLCNPSFSSVGLLWLQLVLVCGYLCPLPSVVGRQLCEQNWSKYSRISLGIMSLTFFVHWCLVLPWVSGLSCLWFFQFSQCQAWVPAPFMDLKLDQPLAGHFHNFSVIITPAHLAGG